MAAELPANLQFFDYEPKTASFEEEVLAGLSKPQKMLPSKFFYDERGSKLFDRITMLPEYYPTRTEIKILKDNIRDIATALGPEVLLIEYGAGSSLKIRILLDHLEHCVGFIPIDISREHLLNAVAELALDYPAVDFYPVCADFTQPTELPTPKKQPTSRALFFPGSTIGNFAPAEAARLLKLMAASVEDGGLLLIGVDRDKDERIILDAYNDSEHVTAAFNMNLLERINEELHGTFVLHRFHHRAVFNREEGRIEMRLFSDVKQTAEVAGKEFSFEQGESIVSEFSYKFPPKRFQLIAGEAGFTLEKIWTDADELFTLQLFRKSG